MAGLGFDPSILFGARGINLPDPMALAQRQMTLGALADQRRVREEQAAAQARAAAEAEALRAALPAVVRGGFSDEAIAGADPRAIPALLQQADKYRKTKAETAKDEAEAESKRSGTKLKVAEHLANEAMWLADHPNLSPDMIAAFQKKVATAGAQDVLTNVPFQDWANPDKARDALRSTGNMFYTIKDRVAAANTVRGQDLTAETARRGQDLTRLTATEGHQVTRRGQDISASTTRRGQDLVNARAIDATNATGVGGKPPPGYRWKADGTLEPIPGGPKDTGDKDARRADLAAGKADIIISKVDEALDKAGFFSTGAIGSAFGRVPGTNAYDLRRVADTIKANLGFAELQAMREASPTGGALGQVAVQELAMLQSTLAAIDADQSEGQLRKNLEQVKKHVANWKRTVQGGQGGGQAPAAPRLKPNADGSFDYVPGR